MEETKSPVTTQPAIIENVKGLDFPGSKQGMQYARTDRVPETQPALGKCPGNGVPCNRYYSRKIHYEEPFDGISEHDMNRIGWQDVQTQPKYVPTSIYPTAGPKTGFAQKQSSFIQLEDEPVDHSNEYFTAEFDGVTPLGGEQYNRVVPEQFGEESEEKFMRSIYTKFALE